MKRQFTAVLIGLALASSVSWAGEPTLKVGDKAPKLLNGKWVQGEPVKTFEPGKAYLVEFWATWCGPCRVSIPHLNDLHNKYKDKGLVVIGQDCWERDDNLVAPFVEKMGDKMTYRVALDDKEQSAAGKVTEPSDKGRPPQGKMAETWMAAAGRNGIPSAFLVDTKGVIAWIGHPMGLQEDVVEQVLAGKFDVEKAAADYDAEQKLQAKLNPVMMALSRAMAKKDWEAAEARLAEADKLMPQERRSNLDYTRFNILVGKKDFAAAYDFARKLSEERPKDVMLQNEIAWRIATDPAITERNLEVADTLAMRANAAANGKQANILDTVARIKFMQGKKDEAIAFQEKAVDLSEGPMKEALQKTLEGYKRGELSKTN